jgi:hypothetical protein
MSVSEFLVLTTTSSTYVGVLDQKPTKGITLSRLMWPRRDR